MKKILTICFLFISLAVTLGQTSVDKRLTKKIENFKKEDFPGIKFRSIYILEGLYHTKKIFEPIFPKLENAGDDLEFLYFYENGGVSFFVAESIPKAYSIIERKPNSYSAVLFKKKNKNIILRTTSYHAIFGFGGGIGYYRQYMKIINGKIYIQEADRCYVYSLSN